LPKTYKRELINEKFGRLTVIEWDKEKSINHNKHHFWFCKCNCGNKEILSIRQDHLISNKIVSCGCYQKERQLANKKENKYIILDNNIVKLWTSNTNKIFYINTIDFDIINCHCWYEDKKGYICSRINNKIIRIHRYILDITDKNIHIDHKDRNKRNNMRDNLRIATPKQNAHNHGLQKNNKSGFRGVFYRIEKGKWQAKIMNKVLKYCDTYEEAVIERINGEIELYEEFRPQ